MHFSVICSHLRACEYWTASIINPKVFKAYPFKSWDDFIEGKCYNLHPVPMGIAAGSWISPGPYFLQTKDKPPYVYNKTVKI